MKAMYGIYTNKIYMRHDPLQFDCFIFYITRLIFFNIFSFHFSHLWFYFIFFGIFHSRSLNTDPDWFSFDSVFTCIITNMLKDDFVFYLNWFMLLWWRKKAKKKLENEIYQEIITHQRCVYLIFLCDFLFKVNQIIEKHLCDIACINYIDNNGQINIPRIVCTQNWVALR